MTGPLPTGRSAAAHGLRGVWRGTISRPSPCYVTVARLTGDTEVGPCEVACLPEPLEAGDPVWVAAIEGRAGDLAVLARRGDTDTHTALWQAIGDLQQRVTALEARP